MKKLLFLLAVTFTASTAFAQSFVHGVGFTILADKMQDVDARLGFGFTYNPRFNFVQNESMSVSVGIPMSIGFISSTYNTTYNTRGNYEDPYAAEDASIGVLINAPVMVNLNMGAGSSHDNDSRFGWFVGAGFGLHWSASTDLYTYDEEGNETAIAAGGTVFGPAANAGMRIGVGSSGKAVEVKLSYFKGLDDAKLNLFGLAAIFNF